MKHTIFPNDIQYLRNDKKISQSQFAKMLNISRTELSQIENGHIITSKDLLEKISKILEVRVSEIYSLDIQKIIMDKR